jgi:hypothetical protein
MAITRAALGVLEGAAAYRTYRVLAKGCKLTLERTAASSPRGGPEAHLQAGRYLRAVHAHYSSERWARGLRTTCRGIAVRNSSAQ